MSRLNALARISDRDLILRILRVIGVNTSTPADLASQLASSPTAVETLQEAGVGLGSKEFLLTEQANGTTTTYPITAVDDVAGKFTIAGDHTDKFVGTGYGIVTEFGVVGSTGNNGAYGVLSVTLNGGNTEIVVNDPNNPGNPLTLPDDTVDGTITMTRVVHTATFDLSGKRVNVRNVALYGISAWASGGLRLNIGDENYAQGFFKDYSLRKVEGPQDTTDGGDGVSGAPFSYKSWANNDDPASDYNLNYASSFDDSGAGKVYEEGAVITIELIQTFAEAPIVPTGSTIVEVRYRVGATPTAATVS